MSAGRGSTPERSDPKAVVQQGQTFDAAAERVASGCGRSATGPAAATPSVFQRGGFASEWDARDALGRELERFRRERRITRRLTLSELVDTYLDQHDVQP